MVLMGGGGQRVSEASSCLGAPLSEWMPGLVPLEVHPTYRIRIRSQVRALSGVWKFPPQLYLYHIMRGKAPVVQLEERVLPSIIFALLGNRFAHPCNLQPEMSRFPPSDAESHFSSA